jgi:integrase
MALMSYVSRHPKTGIYRFRRAVPPPLRAVLGRREIVESLGTKDPDQARRLGLAAATRVQALIDAASGTEGPGPRPPSPDAEAAIQAPAPPPLTLAEAEGIAIRYRDAEHQKIIIQAAERRGWSSEQVAFQIRCLEQSRQALVDALIDGEASAVAELATELLATSGRMAPSDINVRLLTHYLLRALIECEELELTSLRGIWPRLGTAPMPLGRPTEASSSSTILVGDPSQPKETVRAAVTDDLDVQPDVTLGELLSRYHAERRVEAKTLNELRGLVRQFEEVNGANRFVRQVGKKSVEAFKRALLAKPKALPNADRSLPLPEIIEKYRAVDVDRVSVTTVRKAIGLLNAVFFWGERNGYLKDNPFQHAQPAIDTRGLISRREFAGQELARIFSSPIYTGCSSDTQRLRTGKLVIKDAQYWLPLLGTYTGCRLEELGQALVVDVARTDGVLRISIDNSDGERGAGAGKRSTRKEEGGKSLKTASSRRQIPIHPVLLRLGFEEYVLERAARAEMHLFPDLKADRFGKRTAGYFKAFARLLSNVDLDDPALVFHSLRHGFKSACRRAGLDRDDHDFLTGHRDGSASQDYGVPDLPRLFTAVSRLSFPAVEELLLTTA